jgi:segregation and condensation protein B
MLSGYYHHQEKRGCRGLSDKDILNILESILFVSGDAVDISELSAALEIDTEALKEVIDRIIKQKQEENAGILFTRVEDKLQLCSNMAYASYIESVLQPVKKSRLSQSMLETLAIIAYKQPITRFEIEQIRGVKSNYSVATLIEKGLIVRAGRKKALGNPVLYATSDEFLRHFQLRSLNDLPEISEADQ